MIAEDEKFLTQMYEIQLQDEKFKVVTAHNGTDTIEIIDKKKPDLLILDLLMPEKDGFEVLEYIHEKGYTFPVIVLTNLSLDIDMEKCKELGAVDFLLKSEMTTEGLVKKIYEYL